MTNTPMTSKNLYQIFTEITGTVLVNGNEYHEVTQQELEQFMDSVYAQQAQTIAELKEDLLDLRTQVNYRCADVQRLTELNVELVEALDYIAETPIHPNIDVVGMYRNVARKAIDKAKGK